MAAEPARNRRPADAPPPVPGVSGSLDGRERAAQERAERRAVRAERSAARVGTRGSNGGGGKAPRRPQRSNGRPPRAPGSGAPGGRHTLRRVLAIGALLAVLVAGYGAVRLFEPLSGGGEGRVRVVIPSGSGVSAIAEILDERGVVSSALLFRLRASLAGGGSELKSGTYNLQRGMSYGDALDALAAGPPKARVINVTITEGRSRREVAKSVRESDLAGDYQALTERSPKLPLAEYGAEDAENLEGFLFPSTYELPGRAGARQLVDKQLEAFRREFAKVDMSAARKANLTPYEVVIIASMIEREVAIPRERPLVASVIYNRLQQQIPLGIDATIRFAVNNFESPLKQSELEVDSPYNTRENQGLPPGPIGSPGLDSLRAAADPADTDFAYYVVKPNTCGETKFSETYEEFLVDVDNYNRERDARGGQAPTTCPN